MKDLTDFVAIGKEFGLSGDKLFKYATEEYAKYKQDEEKREEKRFEREMRLLERKAQINENEDTTAGTSSSRNHHVPTFKFTPFNEKVDDLDTWFSLFERQCDIYNVKGKDRKPHLMSLISGQCRQVFLSLDVEADYKTIKDALL